MHTPCLVWYGMDGTLPAGPYLGMCRTRARQERGESNNLRNFHFKSPCFLVLCLFLKGKSLNKRGSCS